MSAINGCKNYVMGGGHVVITWGEGGSMWVNMDVAGEFPDGVK